MPQALHPGIAYAIRNDLTHTVLDFTGNESRNVFVMGWGWHGGNNQKWKLIQVGEAGANKWKIQNQRENQGGRFLCPRLEDEQLDGYHRLAGGIVACEFDIELVVPQVGEVERYTISFNNLAVTLVTGEKVHNIQDRDRVLDIYADGPPIALQPPVVNDRAQIWSFLDGLAVTPALQNGRAYKIVNSETGTVLGVANTVGNPVHGLISKGGDHHKWTVTRVTEDRYTFKSTVNNLFLSTDVAQTDRPVNGTALIGREGQGAHFTVRRVAGTRLYKIFFVALPTDNISGLAVNLTVVDGAPDSLDGALVSLQAAKAQQWYFVEVMP